MPIPEDYQYATCRSFGHAWTVKKPRQPTKNEVACSLVMTLECLRCEGIRTDFVGSLGQIEYRYYDMPRGYALHGWTPRDEWRMQWMKERENGHTDVS